MDYSLYFESVPEGKKPENKYQYNGINTINGWLFFMLFQDEMTDDKGKRIDLSDNKVEFINEFLNYHFSKYKGNPEQFFLCLKDLIISTNNSGHPSPGTLNYLIPRLASHYSRLDKLYSPVIEKWIQKRVVLINLPAQQKENNTKNDILPPLPECFIDAKFWNALLLDPRLKDQYEKVDNEKYKWIGKKNLLSGLAFKLLNKYKLIDSINSGQQLAKIFCSYFEVKFDLKDDRTFRPERALIDRFDWIN